VSEYRREKINPKPGVEILLYNFRRYGDDRIIFIRKVTGTKANNDVKKEDEVNG
jgi:hypothetical protein